MNTRPMDSGPKVRDKKKQRTKRGLGKMLERMPDKKPANASLKKEK